MRESLLDTNEEIKSLTRGKEALEKALEHIRKDLKLNQESTETRQSRPLRERVSQFTLFVQYAMHIIYFLVMNRNLI